jgi:hypothetical protein
MSAGFWSKKIQHDFLYCDPTHDASYLDNGTEMGFGSHSFFKTKHDWRAIKLSHFVKKAHTTDEIDEEQR